ncbi:MAG TPA: hypothetical protein VF322_11565 [Gammaproteobacteria bacterium]
MTAASARLSVPSAYDRVAAELARLAPAFGLTERRELLLAAFDAIGRESLAWPLGDRRWAQSRINADGTPFQLATALGPATPALQFLGEAGPPAAPPPVRQAASRACWIKLAALFGAQTELCDARPLLAALAPENDWRLAAEPAGAFWIGAAFAPARPPQLRIYCNGAWGPERDRWLRLDRFAAELGVAAEWRAARAALPRHLRPLGAAVTIARGAAPAGRIYVSGYGGRLADYERLARAVSGERFAAALHRYAEHLLGEDCERPTPSAVCSLGLGAGNPMGLKVELCSHCLFPTDAAARAALESCFGAAGVDSSPYTSLLQTLADGDRLDGEVRYHSYAGIGTGGERHHYSVYLQPKLF